MEVTCNTCNQRIGSENINAAKDTAFCRSCESLTSLSLLLESKPSNSFDVHSPVSGTSVDDRGYRWAVSGLHRSWTTLFLIPFTLVWAGGSLSGIYGEQLVAGEFDIERSLFGVPFLIGSVVLITVCLMSLFGRTLVSVENGKALIFIGIGPVGWYRRFDWRSIDRVVEETSGPYRHISLEGEKRLNLGWGLSEERQYYIANFLRTKLQK